MTVFFDIDGNVEDARQQLSNLQNNPFLGLSRGIASLSITVRTHYSDEKHDTRRGSPATT
jgi:hypothetical protein